LQTRPGGTSPLNVALRLPELGFEAEILTGSYDYLREQIALGRPCIVHVWTSPLPHWGHEAIHALVISDVDEENVCIHDPILPEGPTKVSRAAFMQAWAATDYLTIVIRPAP
ncbi:MAG: cysteine peptidase family C39 domain-containing protein, partial [Anaerolineae bacterium]